MNAKKAPQGILTGLVFEEDGTPCIALSISDQVPVALTIEYAAHVFTKLGSLLDEVGYFDEPEDDEDDECGSCNGCH